MARVARIVRLARLVMWLKGSDTKMTAGLYSNDGNPATGSVPSVSRAMTKYWRLVPVDHPLPLAMSDSLIRCDVFRKDRIFEVHRRESQGHLEVVPEVVRYVGQRTRRKSCNVEEAL